MITAIADKTYIKQQILRHLGKGRESAITSADLASRCDPFGPVPERYIRQLIRELIKDYPIASTTQRPAGFFIAVSRTEAKTYAKSLRQRLIGDALRRRDFLRSARSILHPEQLKLEV